MADRTDCGAIWESVRAQTPGAQNLIHFDNAGAALMSRSVLDVVNAHLEQESLIGGYRAAADERDHLAEGYDLIARLINCQRDEIAFQDSATRAWTMAFYSIPFQAGDRILTCENEYASNYIAYLQVARRCGVTIEVIPHDETGGLSLPHLEKMMDETVKLVSVTHVPTNGGLVNPVEEIGQIVADYDALYMVDACQSVGQLRVDVERIGCDFLSATGRKYLRGPRGTGFLYVGHRALGNLEPPMLDLHSATWTSHDRMHIRPDARCFETWEFNVAARLGMIEAVRQALGLGLERIEERIVGLAAELRGRLSDIKNVRVQDQGRRLCGIVSFNVSGRSCSEVVEALQRSGINVSLSPARYTLLDMQRRGLDEIVRASVHVYNTSAELERFEQVLRVISS